MEFSGLETKDEMDLILKTFEDKAKLELKKVNGINQITLDFVEKESPLNVIKHEYSHGLKAIELGVSNKIEIGIYIYKGKDSIAVCGASFNRKHQKREVAGLEEIEILMAPDYLSTGDCDLIEEKLKDLVGVLTSEQLEIISMRFRQKLKTKEFRESHRFN